MTDIAATGTLVAFYVDVSEQLIVEGHSDEGATPQRVADDVRRLIAEHRRFRAIIEATPSVVRAYFEAMFPWAEDDKLDELADVLVLVLNSKGDDAS